MQRITALLIVCAVAPFCWAAAMPGHVVAQTVTINQSDDRLSVLIDYCGEIDGKPVGIAIFDHPTNPRHPTWWMARGYGYVAADPFGAHAIGGEPPGTGDMTIKAGEAITFRYRFVFHQGDPQQARIDEQYRQYATPLE